MHTKILKVNSKTTGIKKMWYRYSVEHYSTIKRNKIVPYAKMWVSLEIVVQTKSEKKYLMTSLTWGT